MDDGGCILAVGVWWYMIVDIFWLEVDGSILFWVLVGGGGCMGGGGWWWVVEDGCGEWWMVVGGVGWRHSLV